MQLPLMITSRDKALKTMQDIQLEGLKEIDRICRKHNINYTLGGGTCLGQVRHGGFIPWDDDIDIDMTVENYDRFMEIAPEEIDSSRFCLYTRDTEPGVCRSYARLGVLGTSLSLGMWRNTGRTCNVFIEIFRCSYLPDDEKKRKKVATRLFLIRCIQHYKELGLFAVSLDPRLKLPVMILGKIIPAGLLERYENRLVHLCPQGTGWILDDTLIHGNYGGYPSDGVDEFKDVEFEGVTVMSKKDPLRFLEVLYGSNYMDWLPPVKRISHHDWDSIDLGDFAVRNGLDSCYKDFMTIRHTPDSLRQMQVVSNMITDRIGEICEQHNIAYTIAHITENKVNSKAINQDEYWMRPAIVLMLRSDYKKFAEICQAEFGEKFFYQSHETDPAYYYDYARVRLNHTAIRDYRLRLTAERGMNNGFFVKIIPLDNYIKDDNTKDNLKNLRYWRRLMYVKWRTTDSVLFLKTPFKDKIKLLLTCRYTTEGALRKIEHFAQIYNDRESSKCFDSSYQLGGKVFDKDSIKAESSLDISLDTVKADTMEELISDVSRRYGPCHLTYYDNPDHQLSVWRYDEKEDRLLTNEELIGS